MEKYLAFITRRIAFVLILPLILNGCATQSGLTERETGGVAGAAIGAGIGALAGAATGNAGVGTAIGAGAGLLAGAIIGEFVHLWKKKKKKEKQQETMKQQYQPTQYTPQPVGAQTQAAAPAQPQIATAPAGVKQEMNTKYNPRTGQTFPSNYTYDPNTGEELKLLL
jgi:mannitol-specific phosphotransferase system IIBC component